MGLLKIESKGNPGKTLDRIRQYMHGKMTSSVGIPLVSRLCNSARNDSQQCLDSSESATLEEVSGTQDTTPPVLGGGVNSCYGNGADSPLDFGFQFYITDEKGTSKDKKIVMNETVEKKSPSN
ncbi:PREDICTED: ubiquitin carboxyl-terminal hydrolase 8 [Prunus dulcis]|uniref:PREDICTED: ubiquitin carboxyl-terminal hydrolase 8 n=1 Tax=Prunus dulcis TaxID=3755 RepID=A0A5E4GF15_PRUDU|nr:PREDICTED: ubiquitin carboxyl-terminal hydrolase 8 [Prunus dulcis]